MKVTDDYQIRSQDGDLIAMATRSGRMLVLEEQRRRDAPVALSQEIIGERGGVVWPIAEVTMGDHTSVRMLLSFLVEVLNAADEVYEHEVNTLTLLNNFIKAIQDESDLRVILRPATMDVFYDCLSMLGARWESVEGWDEAALRASYVHNWIEHVESVRQVMLTRLQRKNSSVAQAKAEVEIKLEDNRLNATSNELRLWTWRPESANSGTISFFDS